MTFSSADQHYMQRALHLAEQGIFSTDPNPSVGCVFVKNNEIIAEGWTQPAGDLHAEASAIKNATSVLVGTDCYVTLEPCSHHGKTPPCANALIACGIKRLVVALEDPNPQVAGRGIELIKQAGITVEIGLFAEAAEILIRGFSKRMQTGLPFVTLKMGMSMDAKTAMASGESQWITAPESRHQVQRLRAKSSAVITGKQTVISDNPAMIVRVTELPVTVQSKLLRQPIRVVLDSNRSLTGTERIFNLDEHYLWVSLNHPDAANDKYITLASNSTGKIDLQELLSKLGAMEMNEVLVEAGAEVSGAVISANWVDEIQLFMAPVILGHEARDLIQLPGMTQLSDKKKFEFVSANASGPDVQLVFRRGN